MAFGWKVIRGFFKRVPSEWQRPEETVYQQELEWQGFISPANWKNDDLSKYPVIKQDLEALEKYLLPVFWQFNQKSKHFQNRHFLYQRVFIIGSFITAVLALFTTYFDGVGNPIVFVGRGSGLEISQEATAVPSDLGTGEAPAVTPVEQAEVMSESGQIGINTRSDDVIVRVRMFGSEFDAVSMRQLFGLLTTIVGAVTSYFTLVSQQGEPRQRWGKYRRLAEELRMIYFKFLSHLEPYNQPNRVNKLRISVQEVREKALETNG